MKSTWNVIHKNHSTTKKDIFIFPFYLWGKSFRAADPISWRKLHCIQKCLSTVLYALATICSTQHLKPHPPTTKRNGKVWCLVKKLSSAITAYFEPCFCAVFCLYLPIKFGTLWRPTTHWNLNFLDQVSCFQDIIPFQSKTISYFIDWSME